MEPTEREIKLTQLEFYANETNWEGCPMNFNQIQEVYALHNYFLPQYFESSIGCGSCQTRTKNRIFEWFNNNGKAELEQYKLTNTNTDELTD